MKVLTWHGKSDLRCEAKTGFNAMMNGEGDVVSGWTNNMPTAVALVTPSGVLAEQQRKMAASGTVK